METTPNLQLPYIMPAQAQKHVTHNEAVRGLDAIVQLAVADRDLATPPATPEEGARYIVADAASGAWSGKSGQIAAFQDGGWAFFAPNEGWIAWVADEETALVFDGSAWSGFTGIRTVNPAPLVGVNAAADATNRLAVKSDAVLFSHDDATPGTGDLRLKFNKASASGTASLVYQTDWSGRAEIGLSGDDDLHVKVSSDGALWREAMVVDRATGAVSLPATLPATAPFNLLKDAGRFGGSPEPQTAVAASFVAPSYVVAVNGATIAQGPKFVQNNTDYGGSAGALPVEVKALIDKIRDPAYRRYGIEFHTLEIVAGSGTSTARTIDGVDHYLPFALLSAPLPPQFSLNCHILVRSGSIGLPAGSTNIAALYIDGVRKATAQRILPADGWRQVTRLASRNGRQFEGYDNILHNIFATPGAEFLFAASTLTPGVIPMAPGVYYGVVPSLEAWR
ncbi:MAG: DUF2793 domain-containing protein [Mesorhizobium sp.]